MNFKSTRISPGLVWSTMTTFLGEERPGTTTNKPWLGHGRIEQTHRVLYRGVSLDRDKMWILSIATFTVDVTYDVCEGNVVTKKCTLNKLLPSFVFVLNTVQHSFGTKCRITAPGYILVYAKKDHWCSEDIRNLSENSRVHTVYISYIYSHFLCFPGVRSPVL